MKSKLKTPKQYWTPVFSRIFRRFFSKVFDFIEQQNNEIKLTVFSHLGTEAVLQNAANPLDAQTKHFELNKWSDQVFQDQLQVAKMAAGKDERQLLIL